MPFMRRLETRAKPSPSRPSTSALSPYVGTGRFGRTDLAFNGGVIHEVTTVLMVLSLVRDSHSEQVWKKSLQPSPILSAVGGISNTGSEYEVHGCLLHAATGQLVPEALRGHVRPIKAVDEEQRLAFTEVTVLTKPPSLAKRRGVGSVDGSNRYRLLFSIWNTSSLATYRGSIWRRPSSCAILSICFPSKRRIIGARNTHAPVAVITLAQAAVAAVVMMVFLEVAPCVVCLP